MQLKVIDLFAGAGGFTLGFTQLKDSNGKPLYETVWANDFNKYAVDTYNANFGDHCVLGDIVDILNAPATKIPQADVVIGGPPCQGFSLLNKNRELDPRKALWLPFMDVVHKSGASVFVMENVPELLSSDEFKEIEKKRQS
jgi:DNA (cytosine-5)-methyltransferase 1